MGFWFKIKYFHLIKTVFVIIILAVTLTLCATKYYLIVLLFSILYKMCLKVDAKKYHK